MLFDDRSFAGTVEMTGACCDRSADVEETGLNGQQKGAKWTIGVQIGDQHTHGTVGLVQGSDQFHPLMFFGIALTVSKGGLAVIASAGGDTIDPIGHDDTPLKNRTVTASATGR
ncbi:uncharacterized protein METZ01_LOCUS84857 [marine metagenome]|uniref:Uncharacterized protein n=1 Tax=marine metagenome TaxID=408172 RepID=A0A381UYF6_9ZZZZ